MYDDDEKLKYYLAPDPVGATFLMYILTIMMTIVCFIFLFRRFAPLTILTFISCVLVRCFFFFYEMSVHVCVCVCMCIHVYVVYLYVYVCDTVLLVITNHCVCCYEMSRLLLHAITSTIPRTLKLCFLWHFMIPISNSWKIDGPAYVYVLVMTIVVIVVVVISLALVWV